MLLPLLIPGITSAISAVWVQCVKPFTREIPQCAMPIYAAVGLPDIKLRALEPQANVLCNTQIAAFIIWGPYRHFMDHASM